MEPLLSLLGLFFWVIVFIYWLLVFGFGTAWVAGQRGRDGIIWGILGFFTGIFAFIFLALSPTIDKD